MPNADHRIGFGIVFVFIILFTSAILLFDHMNLQVVKFNGFNKAVLTEAGSVVALEFVDVGIQPDWLAQIKFLTDLFYGLKDHCCTGQ